MKNLTVSQYLIIYFVCFGLTTIFLKITSEDSLQFVIPGASLIALIILIILMIIMAILTAIL